MKRLIFLTSLVFLIGFVSATVVFDENVDFGYNNLDGPIMVPAINFSELPTVNSSDYWTTNIGALGNVNAAQFNNIGGTLTIDESHLDTLYCQLTGCTMAGNINMGGNDITNAGTITADLYIGNGSLLTGIIHGIWESIGEVSQLITAEDIGMQDKNLLNVTNITLVNSIKDSDSDSRMYFDDEGAFVIEA